MYRIIFILALTCVASSATQSQQIVYVDKGIESLPPQDELCALLDLPFRELHLVPSNDHIKAIESFSLRHPPKGFSAQDNKWIKDEDEFTGIFVKGELTLYYGRFALNLGYGKYVFFGQVCSAIPSEVLYVDTSRHVVRLIAGIREYQCFKAFDFPDYQYICIISESWAMDHSSSQRLDVIQIEKATQRVSAIGVDVNRVDYLPNDKARLMKFGISLKSLNKNIIYKYSFDEGHNINLIERLMPIEDLNE